MAHVDRRPKSQLTFADSFPNPSTGYEVRCMSSVNYLNPIWRGLRWRFRHECVVRACGCVMFTGISKCGVACSSCNHPWGWHSHAELTIFHEEECVICLDALSVVRFPCHHLCVCVSCYELLRVSGEGACPLCRIKIV